jgi:hypothetical protein
MHRESLRIDSILGGGARGIVMTVEEDPSTFFGFCQGDEPPVSELPIGDAEQEYIRVMEGGPGRAHYTNCDLWQREKRRIEAGGEAIFPLPTSSKPLQIGPDGVTVDPDAGLHERVGEHYGGQPVLQQRFDAGSAIDWMAD